MPDGLSPDRGSAAPGDEARALARLQETGDAIVAGVAVQLPPWVVREVARILDAWGRVEPVERARAEAAAVVAGADAAARVTARLRALLDLDPAEQRSTPLEIVRTAFEEPTAVLAAAGVPPVDRDAFAERAWPDDRYGLVPRTLSDLAPPPGTLGPAGDVPAEVPGEVGDDLGPLHLAWGMAKAAVLRTRAAAP